MEYFDSLFSVLLKTVTLTMLLFVSLSFCPALKVMSQVLRLSQNVAGVTLLALGNGSPDIFSAFAAINQDEDKKSSLAVGALFGKSVHKI